MDGQCINEPPDNEKELIAAILQRILDAWPVHRDYIYARGGEIRISFPPGIGQVQLTWPTETLKSNKRN